MTIGEYIRSNGDNELAALLLNWLITIVVCLDADYSKINLNREYNELLSYLKETINDETIDSFQLFTSSSELQN